MREMTTVVIMIRRREQSEQERFDGVRRLPLTDVESGLIACQALS